MSNRISTVRPEDFDPELRTMVADRSDDELGHFLVYAHTPEITKAFVRFNHAMRSAGLLPPRMVELIRLRLAYLNQCPHCIAGRDRQAQLDGMTPEMVCSLETPGSPSDITADERLALRYANLMATDHLAIDDALFEQLHERFSEPQIVALGFFVAMYLGMQRLTSSWALTEGLPQEYLQTEPGQYSLSFPGIQYLAGDKSPPAPITA